MPVSEQKQFISETSHAIEQWNMDNHKFKTGLLDSILAAKADLTINIDSVRLPSRSIEIYAILLNSTFWFEAGYGVTKYHNPLYLLFCLLNLRPNDMTIAKYSLSNQITDRPGEKNISFTTATRLLSRREKERNRHIRNFDRQLIIFLERMEKEYKKKNH